MQLGSYVLLSTLSHKYPLTLSPQATKAILNVIIDSAPHVTTAQFVKASVPFSFAQQQQQSFATAVGFARLVTSKSEHILSNGTLLLICTVFSPKIGRAHV